MSTTGAPVSRSTARGPTNRGRVRWHDTLRRSLALLACRLAHNAVAEGSLDVATWRVTGR